MTLPLIYIRISRSLSFKEIKKERGVIVPIFKKTLIILSFIFLISILIYLNMYLFGTSTVGIYGVILITYLVIKLGLSFLYEPFKGKPHDYKVAAVIPSYNEDAESLLETLR